MAGFSVMDMLNKTSKEGIEEKAKASFRTKDIDIYNIYANKNNISDQNDIDEKAAEIKLLGLLQPLEVMYAPNDKGEEYRLIGGERRWRALKKLVEKENLREFREATCQIRKPRTENEEIIELCISNSYRRATAEKEIERVKLLMNALKNAKESGEKIMGYDLESGRLRDIAAKILGKKPTQIANAMSINNNLIPELRALLEQKEISFSVAVEIAGLKEEEQEEIYSWHPREVITVKKIREYKQRALEEEKETKLQESKQEAEADETEENEEIEGQMNLEKGFPECCPDSDQETNESDAENVTEEIQEERVEIPKTNKVEVEENRSEERRHRLKLAKMFFDAVDTGKKTFELQKNDRNYQLGDILEMHEVDAGEETGRVTIKEVEYILEGFKGLEEGYCILGIKEKEEQ